MDNKKNTNNKGNFFKKLFSKIGDFYKSHRGLLLIGGGLIIVLIAGAVFLLSSRSQSATVTYTSVKLTKGDITQTIDVVGNVQAEPSAVLNWQTSGIVGPVNLKIGDQVKSGDVLLSLVDSSVSASILNAKNDLLTAQLNLNTLKSGNTQFQTATQTLAAAQYTYQKDLAKRNWWVISGVNGDVIDAARVVYYDTQLAYWKAQSAYQDLYKNALNKPKPADDPSSTSAAARAANDPAVIQAHDVMKADQLAFYKAERNLNYLIGNGYGNNNIVESDFLTFDAAKAAYADAEATWEAYRNSDQYIAAAEAQVKALENTINSSKIIAPFDGTVTNLIASTGQTVASGGEALQMDDLTHLMIDVNVNEADINKLAIGQEANITFAAVPNTTYKGAVVQIGNAGSSSSGVVQFTATIQVTNADAKVKPGFSATVSIITSQVQGVLLVPNQAIITNTSGKSFVLVSQNGKPTAVPVQLGAKSDTYTEVTGSTLKEGDSVLITLSSSSTSSNANNRGLFGILGGFGGGGGEPPRVPSTTRNQSSSSSTGN